MIGWMKIQSYDLLRGTSMKFPDGTTKQLCLRQGVHWNRGQATYVNIVDTHIFLNSETLRAGPKKVDTVLPQNRI